MSDYAKAKGGSVRAAAPAALPRQPLPPLTDAELASAMKNRAFVHEHLPDALPFIADLVKEGLLPGWRGVKNCELLDDRASQAAR